MRVFNRSAGLSLVLVLTLCATCITSSSHEETGEVKSDLVSHLETIFYDSAFAKIPGKVFKAQDFGAVGDGATLCTQAIQNAIDAAHSAGGGIVTLPKGTVVSGALFLKSNVEFRLDKGVTLQAVNKDSQYPDKWTRIAGIEMYWPAALINVYEQKNVRVTGKGLIDGNGKYWWDKFEILRKEYDKQNLRWAADYDCKRVRPIVVYRSENVLMKAFTVQRAGFWTVSVTYSKKVHIDGVVVRNNVGGHGPSTDGIDIDSSSDVLVENCDIDCNDDNYCIKSGRDSDGLRVNIPTENVVIRNSVSRRGHGMITLGSETSGGMNNLEFYNLKGKGTKRGFRLKSAKVRGGEIQNVWIHDVEMDSVSIPFYWQLDWFPAYSYPPIPKHIPESQWPDHWRVLLTKVEPKEKGIPEFHDIHISDIAITSAKRAIFANAFAEKPLRNVLFENVSIHSAKGGKITNAVGWEMRNVTLLSGKQIELENSKDVDLPSFTEN